MSYTNPWDESKTWWDDDIEMKNRHERIVDLVNRLRSEQEYIQEANLEHLKLYIKRPYTMDAEGNVHVAGPCPRIGINGVKSAIDTVCARLTSQKRRAMYSTDGARWGVRLKVRKLQRYVDGLFSEQRYNSKLREITKDAAICGTGFIKWYFEDGKVQCERLWPGEVLVDEQVCQGHEPNSMFQIKYLPLETVLAKFHKYKAEILVSGVRCNSVSANGVITSRIRVIEAWHLPQYGKGGLHTICVDGVTLFEEKWTHDFFPIIPLRWNKLPVGYYGNGAAEDLHGLQEEIDYLMQRIQKAMHLCATTFVAKHISDNTSDEQHSNEIAAIWKWSGEHAPQFQSPPAMNQQVFEHVKWLHELIFDDTGVSQMSATSRKPKGVESGIALQTLLDVESIRFNLLSEELNDFTVECAKVAVALAKKHYRGGKSEYAVKFDGGNFVETIKWEDVNVDSDDYIVKHWPANLLPTEPAGKIEIVERMVQSGMVDAQTGFMLLDFPDTQDYQSLALAAVRNALWITDQVLYEDKDIRPREWHDLEQTIRHMQMGLSRAEMEGAPQEVLERGIQWIADANDLLNPPAPPPPPMDPSTMDPAMAGQDPSMMGQLPPPAPMPGEAVNMGNVIPASAGQPLPAGGGM